MREPITPGRRFRRRRLFQAPARAAVVFQRRGDGSRREHDRRERAGEQRARAAGAVVTRALIGAAPAFARAWRTPGQRTTTSIASCSVGWPGR